MHPFLRDFPDFDRPGTPLAPVAASQEHSFLPVDEGYRMKVKPLADRVVLLIFLVLLAGWFLFIPTDVFRLHTLLGAPPVIVRWAGLGLFIAGWLVVHRTMETNTFAAPVHRDAARPRRSTSSIVMNSPTTPRTPSVPKYLRAISAGTLLVKR